MTGELVFGNMLFVLVSEAVTVNVGGLCVPKAMTCVNVPLASGASVGIRAALSVLVRWTVSIELTMFHFESHMLMVTVVLPLTL